MSLDGLMLVYAAEASSAACTWVAVLTRVVVGQYLPCYAVCLCVPATESLHKRQAAPALRPTEPSPV